MQGVTSTYRWRKLSGDGKQEPGDTLTNGNTSVNLEHGSWQEELLPYLVPQEASQSHRSTTMTAQAGQTKEHDEKQDDVSNERDNGAESDALQVYRTVVAFQYRA
jgi:hypothetical protein